MSPDRVSLAGARVRGATTWALLLAAATACAGGRVQSGSLTPPRDRITDEAISSDLALFTALQRRLDTMPPDTAPGAVYQRAKARGWLAFAREEYGDNDRTQVVADAFGQALTLVEQLERGETDSARTTPLVTGTARVRQDLWDQAEQWKRDSAFVCAPAEIAGLEIELLRAGHETSDGATCRAAPHLAAAESIGPVIAGRRTCLALRDEDRDGVVNGLDRCPGTPLGETVDGVGCPLLRDRDGDGVPDPRDRCPNSAPGATVDAVGCQVLFEATRRVLVLRGVTFVVGRATLTDSARDILMDVAESLVVNPDIRVEVAGHTDNTGTRSLNRRLSQARAESVRAYLIEHGIAADRLVAQGYGPDRPVAPNTTVPGRAQNRRVELRKLE